MNQIIEEKINAEVIAVYPDKVKISVDDLDDFQIAEEKLKVGSYLRIADNDNAVLIAVIENFMIEVPTVLDNIVKKKYIIEAAPLGIIRGEKFERGGDTLTIPPKEVLPAREEEIKSIFEHSISKQKQFCFSVLSTNHNISVPVDGNKFFSKHIAIVGSTGSGKSHTVAKIIQTAIKEKESDFSGLNNTHIIIFDIHSEYKSAFPDANLIDINNLILPYWMLNSDELMELFIDTEANDHRQRSVLKEAIVNNRKMHFQGADEDKKKIHFDSPFFFDVSEILTYISNRNNEKKDKDNSIPYQNAKNEIKTFDVNDANDLFLENVKYTGSSASGTNNGGLINFIDRLENKINDKRLEFLFGKKSKQRAIFENDILKSKEITFEKTLEQLISYSDEKRNVTIIDLSGIPFDILSITVSLISRILFEYGYYYKKIRSMSDAGQKMNNDVPLLLVYEEAHKYVPKSELAKYRASRESIERIAKEGRKYGISLLLASQRPSEISETIFSQCNNFVALRLTNPNDQNYVKKLLPDTMGDLIDKMPALKAGEGLLIGDSVVIPSVVQVLSCELEPSSNDIPYFEVWKEQWKDLDIASIKKEWLKK